MTRSDWSIYAVGLVATIAVALIMDLAGLPHRTWFIAAAVAVIFGVSGCERPTPTQPPRLWLGRHRLAWSLG